MEGSAGATAGAGQSSSQVSAGESTSQSESSEQAEAAQQEITKTESPKAEEPTEKEASKTSEKETGKPEEAKEDKKEEDKSETEKPDSEKETKPEEKVDDKIDEKDTVKKHRYHDRLTEAYPDRKFENDQEYETALDELLNDLDSYKKRGVEANRKLLGLFEASPEVAEVVSDMVAGATFRQALARHISPEDLTPQEGDPDYAGWEENVKERQKKADDRRAFEEDYATNLELTKKNAEEFLSENEMSEEDAKQFIDYLDAILSDAYKGMVSKETLTLVQKARSYEDDIAKAKEDGEISGRNSKIVAEKEESKKEGDGLPDITGSDPENKEKKGHFLDSVLDTVEKRKVLGD